MRTIRSIAGVVVAVVLCACSGSDPAQRTTTPTSAASASEPVSGSSTPSDGSGPTLPAPGEPLEDPSIQAAIDVADGPFSPVEGFGSLWVANHHAAAVTRIDPASNTVIAEIPVGIQPGQLVAAYGSVWVPSYGQSTISRIDPATDSTTEVDTEAGLTCGAPAAAGGLLWIGNCDAGTIAGIDPTTSKLERTLNVAGFTFGNGRQLWVAGDDGLGRIDPKTGDALMTIDLGPEQLASAASFDGERLWVSYREGFGGAVAWVDLATGRTHEIGAVGPSPDAPFVDGDRVFVYSLETGAVSVVETPSDEVIEPPTPLPEIDALFLAAASGSLWLSDFTTGFVYRLELP